MASVVPSLFSTRIPCTAIDRLTASTIVWHSFVSWKFLFPFFPFRENIPWHLLVIIRLTIPLAKCLIVLPPTDLTSTLIVRPWVATSSNSILKASTASTESNVNIGALRAARAAVLTEAAPPPTESLILHWRLTTRYWKSPSNMEVFPPELGLPASSTTAHIEMLSRRPSRRHVCIGSLLIPVFRLFTPLEFLW